MLFLMTTILKIEPFILDVNLFTALLKLNQLLSFEVTNLIV